MHNLGVKTKVGIKWVLIGRFFDRGLDLIKIPVLAYYLSPHDFGLMGIITSFLFYIDVITRTGFNSALIYQKDIEDFLDVGFTFSVFRGLTQSILIIMLIPVVVNFYDTPSIRWPFYAIALSVFLESFISIRIVCLIRELKIKKLIIYQSTAKFFGSLIAIIAAIIFKNIWALIAGQIAHILFRLGLSFLFAPYRPRFELNIKKFLNLWKYGKWVVLSGITMATNNHFDSLLLGKIAGMKALGIYSMAYNIGKIATVELVENLRKIFFPAFAAIRNDFLRLNRAFIKTYSSTILIGGLIATGMILLADSLVSIILGPKWKASAQILKIFGVWCVFQIQLTSFAPLFKGIGRPDIWTKTQIIRLICMILLIFPLTNSYGALGTALTILISTIAPVPVCLISLRRLIKSSWRELLSPILFVMTIILIVTACTFGINNVLILSDLSSFFVFGPMITIQYIMLLWALDSIFKTKYITTIINFIHLK